MTKKVLVIDDEAAVAEMIKLTLEHSGYTAIVLQSSKNKVITQLFGTNKILLFLLWKLYILVLRLKIRGIYYDDSFFNRPAHD